MIHRHPAFSDKDKDARYDIVLLRINGRVTMNSHVSPILLQVSQGNARVEQLCTISGWYASKFRVLQSADIPLWATLNTINCIINFFLSKSAPTIKKKNLYICDGGAGTPLACTSPAGNQVQQEITSFRKSCAHPVVSCGYTRVSSFADWIQTTPGSYKIKPDESTGDDVIVHASRATTAMLILAAMAVIFWK